MDKFKAHRIAQKQVIDKGRNPIALIDGLVEFMENHVAGCDVDMTDRDLAFQLMADIRRANKELDAIATRNRVLGDKPYYQPERRDADGRKHVLASEGWCVTHANTCLIPT